MEKTMRHTIVVVLFLMVSLCTSCGTCDSVPGAKVASRSGQYTVLTKGSNCGPLLSEFDSFVEIERPYYFGRHRIWTSKKTIAGAKLSLDRLKVKWDNERHILIDCRCPKDGFDFKTEHWRDVTVTYTFDQ